MIRYKIIDKDGDLAPMFQEKYFALAKMFAEMRNAKVIDLNTGKIVANYCRCKEEKKMKNELIKQIVKKQIQKWIAEGIINEKNIIIAKRKITKILNKLTIESLNSRLINNILD